MVRSYITIDSGHFNLLILISRGNARINNIYHLKIDKNFMDFKIIISFIAVERSSILLENEKQKIV